LKGETYKLFWPEKAEFVRMAARYGVTIIPFASVGEDELLEVLFLILKISFTAIFFYPLKTLKKRKWCFFLAWNFSYSSSL
jgi:1-acyl-sn-glycerol-3-phosphate acyltransferase